MVLLRRVTGRNFVALLLVFVSGIWNAPSHAVIGGVRMKMSAKLTRYVVAISYKNENGDKKVCTGGIIGPQIVLTAAHCIPKDISTMRVIFGDTQFEEDAVAVTPVVAVRIHPLYEDRRNDWDNAYDLAVIKTRNPLPAIARHLQLAAKYYPLTQIPTVYVIGYGATGFDKKGQTIMAGELNSAIVKRAGSDEDEKFVRLNQREGTGVCVGDSGGPMVAENRDGFIVFGVASTVFNGDQPRSQLCSGDATHVSVSYFKHWIMKQAFEMMQVWR
ncbi:MAG: trypsin-like serine protease [Proteobacteria bacterium]|nr:trypsin-like serine protease [Pseudomonadota bacterium]